MRQPGYIEDAALASGWTAFAVARILRRQWRDSVAELPPHLREPLEDFLEDLDRAARRWQERSRGTAEPSAAELPAESKSMDAPLTTSQAADVLGCTERNIRKLIGAGTLPASKDAHGWHVDAGAVKALTARRKDVTK